MNKKIITNLLLSFFILSQVNCAHRHVTSQNHSNDFDTYACFSKTNLFTVMAATDVSHGNGSFTDILKNTQAAWLRKTGQERWQIEKKYEDARSQLLPIFKSMGLVNEMVPSQKSYTYVFFLGAMLDGMLGRLKTLKKVLADKVKIEEIVILTGVRFLEDFEKAEILRLWNASLTTEAQAAQCMIQKKSFTQKITFINVPQQKTAAGTLRRPTTEDTIKEWLKTNPNPGSVLAISSQPVCLYQKIVLQTILPETFDVEVVGAQAGKDIPVAVYLDSITRTLYQSKFLNKN